ncbi:MAG: metalloregulator ArsR/SmtB family transcription factor [Anaerolineaceae bacterium]
MKRLGDVCDCNVIHQEWVAEVRAAMPDRESLARFISILRVISDQTRFQILVALRLHELCVCDLAVLLDMTKSAVSHQLRILRKSALVKYRRDGKIVYYSLTDELAKIGLNEIINLSRTGDIL